jgi:hypothetical protein
MSEEVGITSVKFIDRENIGIAFGISHISVLEREI